MKKYFIDESGNPDKSKTPDPMPLPGLNSRAQMHAAAERIPGLETHSGGEGKDRAVVVGWDRSAVWRVAGQIGNQQALKRQEREEAEWNQLMQKHELFVSQSSSGDMTNTFSIDDTRGTYIIKCDAMGSYSSEWSSVNNMRLRITNGARQGWVGIFDFNAIEGIMLLDKTKEGLASRVEGLKENDSFNGEDPDDFDSEQEQYNSRQTIGKKRKAVTAGQSSRASKTQKQSKATGGTVFLQWRGQETGEGEIQLDQSNQHVGQLKFSGTADFGFVGEEVHFEGYKIGILGGHATRSWNDYSEDVYERARVGRWH